MNLFRRKPLAADLATGDWTPVPPTAVARPADPVSWLSESVSARPPLPGPPPLPREAFSQEELAIIEEQRRVKEPLLFSQPAPAPRVVPLAEPLLAAPAVAPPARAVRESPPRRPDPRPRRGLETASRPTWIDVLKAYAEHLTDAELRILRQQLQS